MWKYFLIVLVLITFLSCHIRSTTYEDPTRVWLHVLYSNNLIYDDVLNDEDDSLSVIIDLPDQSQITVDSYVNIITPPDLEEESYHSYVVWAKKTDYYTQSAQGSYLDTLMINASSGFTPVILERVCGTIYSTLHYPVRNMDFYILQESVFVDSFTTSESGYFDVDIPFGNYQLSSYSLGPCETLDFNVDSNYGDYPVISFTLIPKPIIYIYPEEEMELSVYLDFPHGGYVTTSIPEYGSGWNDLNIKPTGMINDKFTYLFYESQNPELFQYEEGWIIAEENMEAFFIQNLAATGFEGQEIIDFVDYWIPRFTGFPYYTIYPQYKEQLDQMVDLKFSVEPDNLLRLFYVVEGRDNDKLKLIEPEIPEFRREGFYVVEWGARIDSNETLSHK